MRVTVNPQTASRGTADRQVVTRASQLLELATLRSLLLHPLAVDLNLPNMDRAEQTRWQSRINQQRSACGCREGGISLIASLALYFTWLWLYPPQSPLTRWDKVGIGFAVACLGAGMGKLLGLLRATRALRETIRQIEIRSELKAM